MQQWSEGSEHFVRIDEMFQNVTHQNHVKSLPVQATRPIIRTEIGDNHFFAEFPRLLGCDLINFNSGNLALIRRQSLGDKARRTAQLEHALFPPYPTNEN